MKRMLGLLMVVGLLIPSGLIAQTQAYDFRTGSKVRLWLLDQQTPLTGIIVGNTDQELKLVGEYGAKFSVEQFRVKKAFAYQGKQDNREDASITGVLVGMVVGGVAGYFLRDSGEISCCDTAIAVGARWGAMGAGIGGIIGAVTTGEKEIWRRVPMVSISLPLPDEIR